MRYLVMVASFIATACYGINLPFSAAASIEADFTIKNPEKFAAGKLFTAYLDKAESFFNNIIHDKTLELENIKNQKRDSNRDNKTIEKIVVKLSSIHNIIERFLCIRGALSYASGAEYDHYMKTVGFNNIRVNKSKESDPFNILKVSPEEIDQDRDCLYQFLSWNFPDRKSAAQIRSMSWRDIHYMIQYVLMSKAPKKGADTYKKLLREIDSFFNGELVKEQYDAFIDGTLGKHLVIPDKEIRDSLLERLNYIEMELRSAAQTKLIDAQQYLQRSARAAT